MRKISMDWKTLGKENGMLFKRIILKRTSCLKLKAWKETKKVK